MTNKPLLWSCISRTYIFESLALLSCSQNTEKQNLPSNRLLEWVWVWVFFFLFCRSKSTSMTLLSCNPRCVTRQQLYATAPSLSPSKNNPNLPNCSTPCTNQSGIFLPLNAYSGIFLKNFRVTKSWLSFPEHAALQFTMSSVNRL